MLPAEGGEPLKVFDVVGSPVRELRWTADGRAIVYVETRQGVSNILSQPLDEGPPAHLTNFKTDLISSFAWSRDWSRLVLARGGAPSDVILIRDFR